MNTLEFEWLKERLNKVSGNDRNLLDIEGLVGRLPFYQQRLRQSKVTRKWVSEDFYSDKPKRRSRRDGVSCKVL